MEEPNSNNLLETLLSDKRRVILLIVGSVIFMAAVVVIQSILSPEPSPLPPSGVDQQFNFDQGAEIDIPSDAELPIISDTQFLVHNIEQINHSDLVQQFMVKVGKAFWTKQQYSEIYYVWQKTGSDPIYLVDYDTIQDRVYFRFDQPVDLDLIHNGGVLSTNMLEGYFERFVESYFSAEFTYADFEITRSGGNFRIEANRTLGDVIVESAGFTDYTDYILIEEDGDLIEGQILLVELGDATEVELIAPNLLGGVINRPDYPKDMNQLAPIGLDLTKTGSEPYDPASGFLGDAPPDDEIIEIPTPESCEVRSVSVVYYYIRTTTKNLGPAYRLDCRGEITFQGEIYTVPMIIYANALDPDIVYVPGSVSTQ